MTDFLRLIWKMAIVHFNNQKLGHGKNKLHSLGFWGQLFGNLIENAKFKGILYLNKLIIIKKIVDTQIVDTQVVDTQIVDSQTVDTQTEFLGHN